MLLPNNLIARTLNSRGRKQARGGRGHDKIPMLHVSSLIKSDPADFFCPREFVLRYMERADDAGSGIPPKFELLYAVGHFYGNFVVQQFIERNPDYAKFVWGNWTCVCGESKRERTCLPEGQLCNVCAKPINIYVEVDLFNPKKTVIGHADLIFCVTDDEGREWYFIYEFKSIERADVVFADIKEPLADHLTQASNYYYMLKSEGKRVSKRIRFVYIDRSMTGLYTTLPFREVSGEAIPKHRLHKLYERAAEVHKAIRTGYLPERKCTTIDCSRAKQCHSAISCFNRKRAKIERIPLALTHPSLALASTADQSTTKNGSGSRLKRKRTKAATPAVSSPSVRKLRKPS